MRNACLCVQVCLQHVNSGFRISTISSVWESVALLSSYLILKMFPGGSHFIVFNSVFSRKGIFPSTSPPCTMLSLTSFNGVLSHWRHSKKYGDGGSRILSLRRWLLGASPGPRSVVPVWGPGLHLFLRCFIPATTGEREIYISQQLLVSSGSVEGSPSGVVTVDT